MASVGQRQMKAQSRSARAQRPEPIEAVKISSQSALFYWLKEISRLTPVLGGNGVAFALRLYTARNKRDGFSFPSHRTIARDLGVSESSTYRYQKQLAAAGLLIVEKRKVDRARHYHNLYFLSLPADAAIRRNALENNDEALAPVRDSKADDLSPVTGRDAENADDAPASGETGLETTVSEPTTSHQCEVTTSHQCETNHILGNQGEPSGSPLLSSISGSIDVAREAEDTLPVDDRGTPEARPDEAFRSSLEPRQLSFYDQISSADQDRYRELDRGRRDEFQDFHDYIHGHGDDDE